MLLRDKHCSVTPPPLPLPDLIVVPDAPALSKPHPLLCATLKLYMCHLDLIRCHPRLSILSLYTIVPSTPPPRSYHRTHTTSNFTNVVRLDHVVTPLPCTSRTLQSLCLCVATGENITYIRSMLLTVLHRSIFSPPCVFPASSLFLLCPYHPVIICTS